MIILILTVIIVIKIKYKYGKMFNSTRSSTNESEENTHYKSFKFDSDNKKFPKSDDSFGSECSESPLSVMTSEPEPGRQCSTPSQASSQSQHSPYSDKSHTTQVDRSNMPGLRPNQSLSVGHTCDNVTSWTPFLSRNCEESVI